MDPPLGRQRPGRRPRRRGGQRRRRLCTGLGGCFNDQTQVGDTDAFLIKVRPDGKVEWTRLWGSKWADAGYDVAVGDNGLVYVVGMAANVTFDDQPAPGALFMTCFDASGLRLWTRRWGASVGEARGVAFAGTHSIFTAGSTYGAFDGQPIVGDSDLWLTRWGPEPPPQITEGPIVLEVTSTTARIWWKTDRDCNSAVQYSRTPGLWENAVTNSVLEPGAHRRPQQPDGELGLPVRRPFGRRPGSTA